MFESRLGHLHRSRLGRLFHPSRQVNGITQGSIFHAQIGAHGAHHNQAGVNPNPEANIETPLLLYLIPIMFHRLKHIKPGEYRPLGIVFVGKRCAKKCQQPIAHQPRDSAFIAVYWLNHMLKSAIDDL